MALKVNGDHFGDELSLPFVPLDRVQDVRMLGVPSSDRVAAPERAVLGVDQPALGRLSWGTLLAQAQVTPTPFRFLTPTPVAARPVTGATTTPPRAGGMPDSLILLLLAGGVSAVIGGVYVLRRDRRPVS